MPFTFYAAGVPSGASVSFTPATAYPGDVVTATITAASSIPTTTIAIVGIGNGKATAGLPVISSSPQ